MKNEFVADGRIRFWRGKKTATFESVEKKYAEQLADASTAQKSQIHSQMIEEYFQTKKIKSHKPSAYTLW
jgi:hypothetical protein